MFNCVAHKAVSHYVWICRDVSPALGEDLLYLTASYFTNRKGGSNARTLRAEERILESVGNKESPLLKLFGREVGSWEH